MTKERQRRRAERAKDAGVGHPTGKDVCPIIVVGIGASEGGLKSLKRLLAKMPSGHGVAFVLIQHSEPSGEPFTVGQLRAQSGLAVVEARDGMPVLPDRIYVIPPDKLFSLAQCRMSLLEPIKCEGLRMPIDHFFCALAADQGRRGCGIVLSGSGSDGTMGLSEIKAAGGRTIVEDPRSAEFPSMPQGAIDAGVADAALSADSMPEAILALVEQTLAETRNEPEESPEFDADLRAILDILRAKVGHDFRCYKPNTLVRRIRRRMTLGKITTFAEYSGFLREHPEEVGHLQKDLLIGVTEFLRQPQAWEILEEKVISALVERAQPGSEIRVWVPGCSTGEEAYSLAMLLAEEVKKSDKKVEFQIFATDSDIASLATARSGSYSEEDLGPNVSLAWRKRFFTHREDRYKIIKEIRKGVVFAPQNLTADPPFSRLDLISCRNLLMYFDQQVQQKIIALFHFALREGGFLFLGTAETVGEREDLFEPVSKKWRIYRRIGVGRTVGVEIPVRPTGEPQLAAGKPPVAGPTARVSLASATQQMLLDRFAPACVMIDRKLQLLYVHGAVEDYLTFPSGELTMRVVDMAREGLRARLRGAISQCLEADKSIAVTARVRRGKMSVPIKATVSPLRYPREADGLLLVTFEDYRLPAAKSRRRAAGEIDVHQLEDELKVTREELQSTIDQLESSNDQLKASNEEVTASNEELQSANEELETSKEELQSLNEELNTINARLQEKVDELEGVNNDLVNLLSSTHIATVFLDKELRVKRYTPAITRLLSLIPSDVGRPIADILRRFSDESLLVDAARVLTDLTPIAKEVQAEDDSWYIRRITPYRTQDDRIEGVVVTFMDVSDMKQAAQALHEVHEQAAWLARFPEQNPNPIIRVSADGKVLYCNPSVAKLSDWACEVGRPLPNPLLPLVGRPMAHGQNTQQDVQMGERFYTVWVAPFPGECYANLYGLDITDRKQAEEAILRAKQEWERTFDTVPDLVAILDPEHRIVRVNRAMADRLGVTPEQCIGLRCHEAVHGLSNPPAFCPHALTCQDGQEHMAEVHEPRLGGDFLVSTTALCDEQGLLIGAVHVARDITGRKRAEVALRESEERLKRAQEIAHLGSWELNLTRNELTWSDEVYRIFGLEPQEFGATYEAFLERVHPDDRAAVDAAYSGSIREGKDSYEIAHRVVRKGTGEMRWVHEKCQHVRDDTGQIIRSLGMVLDITERKRAEEEQEGRIRRLNTLVQVGADVLSAVSMQDMLETVVDAARALTRAKIGTSGHGYRQGDFQIGHTSRSPDAPVCPPGSIFGVEKGGVYMDLIDKKFSIRLTEEELQGHPRWWGLPDGHSPLKGLMGARLMGRNGEANGLIMVSHRQEGEFTAEDELLLKQLAYLASIGLHHIEAREALTKARDELEIKVQERTAKLEESEHRLRDLSSRLLAAQEEERKRIALELHDGLGSMLTTIKFKLEASSQAGERSSQLDSASTLLGGAVEECRRMQMALRPAMLDDLGLLAAVSWLCREFSKAYSHISLDTRLEIEEHDIPDPLKTVIYRIYQEALNNAAKHGGGDRVEIALERTGAGLEMTVRDNGSGFDVAAILSRGRAGKGLGLSSMMERAQLSGGRLSIESAAGQETTVRAIWPLG